MDTILAIIAKILKVIPTTIAGAIGIIQALIKFAKEAITLVVDVLFPVIPVEAFKVVVLGIRDFINKIDSGFEWVKQNILTKFGLV